MRSTIDLNALLHLHALLVASPLPVPLRVAAFEASCNEFECRSQHHEFVALVGPLKASLTPSEAPIVQPKAHPAAARAKAKPPASPPVSTPRGSQKASRVVRRDGREVPVLPAAS